MVDMKKMPESERGGNQGGKEAFQVSSRAVAGGGGGGSKKGAEVLQELLDNSRWVGERLHM